MTKKQKFSSVSEATITKRDALKIMRKIGMGQYCQNGREWLRHEAPSTLHFEDFPYGRPRSNLSYFMYVNKEKYHSIFSDLGIYTAMPHEFDWNVENWEKCCTAVKRIVAYIDQPPFDPLVMLKSDVMWLIEYMEDAGTSAFCQTGKDWLMDCCPDRITLNFILAQPVKVTDYLSYFFVCAYEDLGALSFLYPEGNPPVPFIDRDKLVPSNWALMCGATRGLVMKLSSQDIEHHGKQSDS
jgi:hypothetical protein